ncbi:hypothetical protein TYRP_001434 [Tyrophagus putrescentiae]|nr:hypothetical protein TYRP_001434 [Tyrophagus putrescentiae]
MRVVLALREFAAVWDVEVELKKKKRVMIERASAWRCSSAAAFAALTCSATFSAISRSFATVISISFRLKPY